MTLVAGIVTDTSGRPLDGVLWVTPGEFRTGGEVVYAPQRTPYPIEQGEVSADLVPGPALMSVQCGGPTHPFNVTIPEVGPVTLASLIGD